MTLPPSGSLTIAQIATELGRTGSQTIPDNGWRTLAGVAAGEAIVIPTNYYSKTRGAHVATSGLDSGASCSFASQSFGAVGPARRLAVAVHWTAAEFNRTLSSATIGGVAAAIHVQDSHSGSEGTPGATSVGAAIISAVVATGTSGTILCNFSGAVTNCKVATYRLVDCAISTVAEVQGFGDTSVATTIDISGTSILILAGSGSTGTTGNAMTFAGATEEYDLNIGGALSGRMGGCLSVNLANQANRPISLNMGVIADSGVELVAATFN